MSAEDKICAEIRTRLLRFTNHRERAYREVRKKGHPVPDYSSKIAAILFIRIHLEACIDWNLHAHVRLVAVTLRRHIQELLPFEFHSHTRQLTYRNHILDLVRFCEQRLAKFQNHHNPKAA